MIELVLRIIFSLAVVLFLMWGLAKLVRRPLTGGRGAGPLSVLGRTQVGRNSAVTVIRVADRALVLGVTDNQVSLLGETEVSAFEQVAHEPGEQRATVDLKAADGVPAAPGPLDGSLLSGRTWRSTLDFLRERTARH